MPPEQYWWALAALAAGTFLAVFMAKPRKVIIVEKIVEPENDVDYATEIMPTQEEQYPDLVEKLRETARRLAADGREISSDDIHEASPLPPGVDGRVMGAAFHPKKDWVRVRWEPSRRAVNNKRPVSIWRLRETIAKESAA